MTAPNRAAVSAAVLLLFFLSGATGLVYEVIWLRKLVLIFGSTLFATSTILSTFMGGLALGAFAGGRAMDRWRFRPLRLYGVLEVGIGLYAVAVPTLLNSLTPLYRAAWEAGASESFLTLSIAKFFGIAVVLLPPTILMGASLPALARQVADDPDRIGGKVGTLYAVNTFGAVAGTFVAGFVAIPLVGVQRTIWITATVNVLLGIVAFLLATSAPALARGIATAAVSLGDTRVLRRKILVALAAFGLSGFAAMVLEVAWTRALTLVLGSSVYAFAMMLIAFLIGLAAGGAAISGLLRRRPGIDPGTLLAVLLASAGVLAYATAFVFNSLPRMFAEIYFAWTPSAGGWFAVQLLFSLLVMFPATFAFGGVFPAVLQLHARNLDVVSRSVGVVYASNTLGTIFGAAIAGFVLVPYLGVRNTVVSIAAMEIGLAIIVALSVTATGRLRRSVLALPMAVVLVTMMLVRPGWDVMVMNSGVYTNILDYSQDSDWDEFWYSLDNKLLFAAEGLTASVMVGEQTELDNIYLAVNGKVDASSSFDMETQIMCAHLPLLLHDDPHDVMVIGLASGVSVGSAATHPVDRIKVVEVEKEMIPAAKLFAEHNGNVLEDTERVTISVNDARNELAFSPETYDVVISEPSNPWMTVASNLFTEDFFRLARQRVRTGGIFCQWIQNYHLPSDDLRAIIAGFKESFPHVLLFQTYDGVDLLLLGSDRPLVMDLDRINERLSELRVRMDAARVGVRSEVDVLALFWLGENEVDRLIEGAPRNTDDNARVEFSAPKALYRNNLAENRTLLNGYAVDPLLYTSASLPQDEADLLRLKLAEKWAIEDETDRAEAMARQLLGTSLAASAKALLGQLDL